MKEFFPGALVGPWFNVIFTFTLSSSIKLDTVKEVPDGWELESVDETQQVDLFIV